MDIFKQKRNYIVTIVILVIINITCLLLLWLGKPKHNMRGSENQVGEKVGIQEMLKEELGFSIEQTEQFLALRESHKEKSTEFGEEIMLLKKEMFNDAMYGNNVNISDSLLNISLEKQSQIEKITFQHFLKLKQICTPEQKEKLFGLMHQLLGPPPGEMPDGPPPPPGNRPEGPPPHGNHPPKRN